VPKVRLFAQAREAAGTGADVLPGGTVDEVLQQARQRYGTAFVAVLEQSRVWVNGEVADPGQAVDEADEVAILPPVSGGC
jgi:molybdopterin converting factor small subunit